MMKNKKGVIPVAILFLGFIVVFVMFMFGTGAITSFIFKRAFAQIPGWFWVALVGFVLIVLLRRNKK